MTDLTLLTILLGILGFLVIGLIWLVLRLEARVEQLRKIAEQIERGGKK